MNVKEQLRQIAKEFMDEYNIHCTTSRNALIKSMRPGEPVPPEGEIYGIDYQNAFNERASLYRSKVDTILDAKLDEALKAKTKAPEADVANTIVMLSARDNVTEDDINDMVSAYGDNYQVYRSLQDIAKKNGAVLPDHPLAQKETVLLDAKRTFDNFMTYKGASTKGNAFVEFALATLPDEL